MHPPTVPIPICFPPYPIHRWSLQSFRSQYDNLVSIPLDACLVTIPKLSPCLNCLLFQTPLVYAHKDPCDTREMCLRFERVAFYTYVLYYAPYHDIDIHFSILCQFRLEIAITSRCCWVCLFHSPGALPMIGLLSFFFPF